MDDLWATDALLAATGGRPVGDLPEGITGISIDTRTLNPGEAFFAIKGDQFDGHDFIGAAAKAGAALAVVDESKLVALGRWNLPLVVVRDVLEAMVLLGRAARRRTNAQILAITGSAGKTSTKEMMRSALSACGKVHASVASFNNHWGVPLTLARMPQNTEFGIFEIGMNHAGEIESLVDMVRPHVALVTNVAAAHIGAFSNEQDIARAKAEIFSGVVAGGYAVINRDNEHHKLLARLAKKAGVEHLFGFGRKKGSEFLIRETEISANGYKVAASIGEKALSFELQVPGEHMVSNAIAVLGCAQLANADIEIAARALGQVQAEKGRGHQYVLSIGDDSSFTLIDESFNANPASMKAGLEVLYHASAGEGGRKIAVLGDMLEMGASSIEQHADLSELFEAYPVDKVYLAGPEMVHLKERLSADILAGHYDSAGELEKALIKDLAAEDVVMVKASKGLKFSPMVENIVTHFGELVSR